MSYDDAIETLRLKVDELWRSERAGWPNEPCGDHYVEVAEEMGLVVQVVCDSSGSTGAYYNVWSIYEPGADRFRANPIGLIFQDFNGPTIRTYVMSEQGER